ncbi:MAG TPA: hypothetical protein VF865_13575 [Acidobacteriaceae bacterium]
MPIQIRDVKSLPVVEEKIRAFEARYAMSSEAFTVDLDRRVTVPEFDAIEWNFLLMQKEAMEEDDACGAPVIWSNYRSKISAVEPRTMYDDVAA